MSKPEKLCTLPNGRDIYPGDKVYRTELRVDRTAQGIYVDFEGDDYLTFEEGGNALVKPVSSFYLVEGSVPEIKLR